MRRPTRPALLAALAATALLAPPALAEEPAAGVTDPCGDTDLVLDLNGFEVFLNGRHYDGFDVAALRVADLPAGGLDVLLTLCGDVPGPELPGASWAVSWDLPAGLVGDQCSGSVVLADALEGAAVVRSASVRATCTETGRDPVTGGSTVELREAYRVALPAADVVVDGRTIRFQLRRDADLGPAAAQLEAGTVLGAPVARTRDGRRVTEASFETGVPRTPVSGPVRLGPYSASGPGVADRSDPAPDHRVG